MKEVDASTMASNSRWERLIHVILLNAYTVEELRIMQNQLAVKRLSAMLFDLMIATIFYFLFYILLCYSGYSDGFSKHFLSATVMGVNCSFIYAVEVYYIVQELIAGTTIGKRMLGLMVVNHDLSRPNSLQILVRNVFRVTDHMLLIGCITLFFDKKFRRFGDFVAGTRVIEKNTCVLIESDSS